MLRALSVRRSRRYERLVDETTVALMEAKLEAKLERAKTVPARRSVVLAGLPEWAPPKPAKKVDVEKKGHPLFRLFDRRWRSRRTTSRPEFARYLEYVKEGGIWDAKSNMPVLYYK